MNATEVMKNLHKKGVGTRPFFWPLHLQPVFKPNNIRLKNSEFISKFGFYLPSGVGTTIDEVEKSSDILIDILK
jgi:perosamine synthetase